ncbi:MAG: hypothetical protein DHS20C05_21730 [Hyphococcus sp.]|nr:MAG: hypothetical protein DHS20C05_21730 [Marinicaulis sp.]
MNKLGIDIGGVIITKIDPNSDTSFFSGAFLETPPEQEAFSTIRDLRERAFGDEIYIVSKCGPSVEKKTREWLEHHQFWEVTGVPSRNLHFCRTRAEKAPICEALGIQVFVDDRIDVLAHMKTVNTRILFGAVKCQSPYIAAPDWRSVNEVLLG